jgi:hypothetical protein
VQSLQNRNSISMRQCRFTLAQWMILRHMFVTGTLEAIPCHVEILLLAGWLDR